MVDPYRAAAPVHVRRDGHAHRARRRVLRQEDTHRHLPGDRHPRRHRDLQLRRPAARGVGEAHRQQLRALPDDVRVRHRPRREPVAVRHRGHQDLPAAGHERREDDRADHGDRADGRALDAAGHGATADHAVQRDERADHAGRAGERHAVRAGDVRLRRQLHPQRPRDHPGHADPVAVRRKTAADRHRSRSAEDARDGHHRARHPDRGLRAERDPAVRHREDGRQRVPDHHRVLAGDARRARRDPDQDHHRQPHDLRARRRDRPRRLHAADQRGPRRGPALALDDDPEERRCVDARCHRRDPRGAAEGDRPPAARRARQAQGQAAVRSERVRARVDQRRAARGARRRGADRGHDPRVPRQLALDLDRRDLDPAVDPVLDHRAARARPDAQRDDARRPRARRRRARRRRDRRDREHPPQHRAAKTIPAGDRRRRATDRGARVRVDAVHLHRVRADRISHRLVALPVRADGDGRRVRDADVVRPVAHAGADDGALPAREGSGEPSRAELVRALVRREVRDAAVGVRPVARVDARAPRVRGHAVRDHPRRLDAAVSDERPRLLPDGRRRPHQAARPRRPGHAHRGEREAARQDPPHDHRPQRSGSDALDHPAERGRDDHRRAGHAVLGHQPVALGGRADLARGLADPDRAEGGPQADGRVPPGDAREARRSCIRRPRSSRSRPTSRRRC